MYNVNTVLEDLDKALHRTRWDASDGNRANRLDVVLHVLRHDTVLFEFAFQCCLVVRVYKLKAVSAKECVCLGIKWSQFIALLVPRDPLAHIVGSVSGIIRRKVNGDSRVLQPPIEACIQSYTVSLKAVTNAADASAYVVTDATDASADTSTYVVTDATDASADASAYVVTDATDEKPRKMNESQQKS